LYNTEFQHCKLYLILFDIYIFFEYQCLTTFCN
jgi:hypothetical protein